MMLQRVSPEMLAYKMYGEADYFWVVTLVNNIVNRYYDWYKIR